ncbi:MAG: helix-turn-helix transcriptional regulator [Cellvibrio sp.]|uniref:helix-turn-helix domain-containing protein n=1 Tax=Cellvibrio sp. TaxID=1965322 RepID=UPI0031AB0780
MNIGERIKQLRTDKNLTQPQLAELANIEQSYLSKLENDKSVPSADILMAVLRALSVDIPTFLQGLDESVIERHLMQVPEITLHRNVESRLRVRAVKRWLFASALCCAVGLALVFGGLKLLLFSPVETSLYKYVSDGVILAGEPEGLFDQWEFNLRRKMSATTRLLEPDFEQAFHTARDEFRKRLSNDNKLSIINKGQKFREEVSGGYRIYQLQGVDSDTNRVFERYNNWLAVLGAFLAFGGLTGFFVEFRLRRL